MNPYAILGSSAGTNEAAELAARLSTWHDAMVAHERKIRMGTATGPCDDECPHAEARVLFSEAVVTFGPRAHDLAFLRSRANETLRRSRSGGAVQQPHALAADRASRSPARSEHNATSSPGRTRAAAEW